MPPHISLKSPVPGELTYEIRFTAYRHDSAAVFTLSNRFYCPYWRNRQCDKEQSAYSRFIVTSIHAGASPACGRLDRQR